MTASTREDRASHSDAVARFGTASAKVLTAAGTLWLLLEVANYFIPTRPLSEYRLTGLLVFGLLALVIGLGNELRAQARAHSHLDTLLMDLRSQNAALHRSLSDTVSQDAAKSLLAMLREAHSRGSWEEVIMLGHPLSRPLWLTGRYHLRMAIGTLVESAASFCDRLDVQAATLIDDLGWTSVALRRYAEAIGLIKHGITIAEKAQKHGLVCRALRHLAGIAVKQGNLNEAECYANEAEAALHRIPPSPERDELVAGLVYQRATQLHARGDYSAALERLTWAQELFVRLSDRERAIKIYGNIGNAHLALGQLAQAKDSFRRGLASARVSSRHDCELVALSGLAKVLQAEGHYDEAQGVLRDAARTAALLGDSERVAELEQRADRSVHAAEKPGSDARR